MSTHTRIRQFNTRDTYPGQNLDNDLCQAVVAAWQPQREDYITRGLHPASAPAYGVAGDQ